MTTEEFRERVFCAVCGMECGLDFRPQPNGRRFGGVVRAMYFDADDGVDFCGAACSLAWEQRRGPVEGRWKPKGGS